MNSHDRALKRLIAGTVCAALIAGGAPLFAAEVIEHSFPSSSGESSGTAPANPGPQQAPSGGTASTAAPPPAGSLEARVTRLEHTLDSGTLVDMLTQVQQLQQELQAMRGELEVQRHDLDTLQQHQRDLYLDVDRRLRNLEVGKATPAAATAAGQADNGGAPQLPNATPQLNNATPQLNNATPQLNNATPGVSAGAPSLPNASPQLSNAVPPGAGGQPSASGAAPSPPPAGSPSADTQAAYEQAFNLLRGAQYGPAITSFQKFISDHPQGPLADNAQYWLGEAEYVTRQFPAALKDFQGVVARYPDSAKVPDAQLKVGFTYYEMGKWDDARKALNEVVQKYPDTSAAKLAENRLQKMRGEGH